MAAGPSPAAVAGVAAGGVLGGSGWRGDGGRRPRRHDLAPRIFMADAAHPPRHRSPPLARRADAASPRRSCSGSASAEPQAPVEEPHGTGRRGERGFVANDDDDDAGSSKNVGAGWIFGGRIRDFSERLRREDTLRRRTEAHSAGDAGFPGRAWTRQSVVPRHYVWGRGAKLGRHSWLHLSEILRGAACGGYCGFVGYSSNMPSCQHARAKDDRLQV
uniref:Uncharacterized protein n=1 Tax=Oryza sativa subsp. japonica TaxID=39947 RepID=Q75GP4_ORYSJ|nr:hypothetical protein [Oryza sativa Japonica Group]